MNFLRRHITSHPGTSMSVLVLALTTLFFLLPEVASAQGADMGAFTTAVNFLAGILYWFVVLVFGMLVYLGGMLLNASINYFVLGFGSTFLNSGIGFAVDSTWVIIRDFVNLAFIFGLVYIGFKMILDSDNSNTRRWLGHLIIAALMVNFSLFITKAVIDFSNQISAEIAVAGLGAKEGGEGKYESDVAGELMHRMGITSVFAGGKPKDAGFGYVFGTAILFMVTAFVFAAGGMLLMIRFAVLNLYLVLSPLMFIGWIIAPLGDTMGRYWKDFLKRCFFAPIYLLFIYFSFQIIGGLQTSIKTTDAGGNSTNLANPQWAATFNANPAQPPQNATLGTLPFFVLICIFMMLSLVAANKLGAEGAGQAVSMGKRWGTKTAKWTGAQTGGRIARRASYEAGEATSRGLRNLQQVQGDKWYHKATRNVARSNAVQGTVGAGAESMQKAKFGMSRTIDEDTKMRNQNEKQSNNGMTVTRGLQAQREKELAAKGIALVDRGNGALEEEFVANLSAAELARHNDPETQKKREKQIEEMQRVAADMSTKDFEAMTEDQQIQVAQFLSGSQTESIMKSDNITDTQKKAIGDAQKEAVKKIITENGVVLSAKLADLSTRQIEILGDEFVSENAHLFTDSQFGDIKKSKKFTEGQVGRYIGNRKTGILNRLDPNHRDYNPESVFSLGTETEIKSIDVATRKETYGAKHTKPKKVADIAKLPGEALVTKAAIPHLTIDVLKAIASGDKDFEKVSTSQREEIMANLATSTEPSAQKALAYLKSAKGQDSFFGQEPLTTNQSTSATPTGPSASEEWQRTQQERQARADRSRQQRGR